MPISDWLRRRPQAQTIAWTLIGFLPFAIAPLHLYMALVSWPFWPGYVKGAEISVLDLIAIALYLGMPRTADELPFRLTMAAYFVAVVLSALQAGTPPAALFYAWQLARMALVYAVIAKGCAADPRAAPAILNGMVIGLAYQALDSLWERFGHGVLQAGGGIGHQNLLGLMTHFVVFPCAALALAGARGWRTPIGPGAGLVVAVLTVSRATIGLAGAGYAALFALSSVRSWTPRKAVWLGMALAGLAVLVPVVQMSLAQRFEKVPFDVNGYDERAAFEAAAKMMLADHPLGVGANSYVVAANTRGYNARAGVAYVAGSEGANVHNVYWLVAAETGYPGLVTFLAMLVQPLIVAFACGWRARKDPRGDLLIGAGVSLLVVYLHCNYEWIFVTFSPQYLFAIDVGLVAGLATELGYWRPRAALPATGDPFIPANVALAHDFAPSAATAAQAFRTR